MTVRYIGSKARLVDAILPVIGRPRGGAFVDAFCGTGAVARAAALAGWSIRLNDSLAAAVTMAHAQLVSASEARFAALGGYPEAIARLEAAAPRRGFVWREYSPESAAHAPVARMYFTPDNAARIDGARQTIADWRQAGTLTVAEERLLIADLLLATNRVANIAGTYGCFLSRWSAQARERLMLRPRELAPRRVRVDATIGDVGALATDVDDLLYLDPPYTKRQYAAYYHVLETITHGDAPAVGGVTGLRPWQDKASDFCHRKRALDALVRLVEGQAARRVLLSYSDQGHVPLEPLASALASFGDIDVLPLKRVGRYRPNRVARDNASAVTEYLVVLRRRAGRHRRRAVA